MLPRILVHAMPALLGENVAVQAVTKTELRRQELKLKYLPSYTISSCFELRLQREPISIILITYRISLAATVLPPVSPSTHPTMASLNLSTNGPSIKASYQKIVDAPAPSGPAASSPSYGQWAVYAVQAPLVSAFQHDSGKESVLKVQSTGGKIPD